MLPAPGQHADGGAGDRLVHHAGAAGELQRIAAHEVACRIGLVELLAPQHRHRRAVAVHLLIDIAAHLRPGMQHQVPADLAAGIGQPVGKPAGGGVQQQARRADAVAGQDHHFRRLEPFHTIGIVVDRAGGHAVFVGGDLPHPAARAQFHAGANRLRPVGDIDAGLGALRAARRAVTEVDARRAPVILGGGNGGVGRPPVPAQLVHRPRVAHAGAAERQWRHRRLVGRIGGIAGQAGHAHHAVVLGEVRLQRRVIDRPVIGHAVQRTHAEIRRVHPRDNARCRGWCRRRRR